MFTLKRSSIASDSSLGTRVNRSQQSIYTVAQVSSQKMFRKTGAEVPTAPTFFRCHIHSLRQPAGRSEEETYDLATGVLPTGLLVHQHTVGGRQDEVSELTGRENIGRELFDPRQGDVHARRDHTALVQPSDQVHHDLP